jgi:sulfur-carrier protein
VPILVKLSTSLRPCVPDYDRMTGLLVEASPGLTVAGLIQDLGLEAKGVKIIMVNGRAAPLEASLKDGDRVGLFPPVGGG